MAEWKIRYNITVDIKDEAANINLAEKIDLMLRDLINDRKIEIVNISRILVPSNSHTQTPIHAHNWIDQHPNPYQYQL